MNPPLTKPSAWDRVRNAFFTGLLVLGPAAITVYVVWRLFVFVDHLLGTTLRGVPPARRDPGDRVPHRAGDHPRRRIPREQPPGAPDRKHLGRNGHAPPALPRLLRDREAGGGSSPRREAGRLPARRAD